MSLLQNSNAISSGGYTINNSLRFRASASAYLSRTPASAGNRQTWTWSAWVKRGALGSQMLEEVYNAANDNQCLNITFQSSDQLQIGVFSTNYRVTTQVFRDPSAWYHIVVVADTTQATANNRLLIYVNGTQVTAFSTLNNPSQNQQLAFNQNVVHALGARNGGTIVFDGYLAEVNFIDGQALTPSSFGQTDTLTGVWTAKKYTGTYGTNGFYLPFSDTTSATTLAYDKSGNGNNWTANNISTTAGVTYDAMIDSPTLGVSGTRPVGNYATINPLSTSYSANISDGNLKFSNVTTGQYPSFGGSIGVSSGKWYYEATPTNAVTIAQSIGFTNNTEQLGFYFPNSTGGVGYGSDGNITVSGTVVATVSGFVVGDTLGVALNLDAGTAQFYKNGVVQSYTVTGLSGTYIPAFNIAYHASQAMAANFGQRPFQYSPPTGFKALCTTNLPDSTIVKGNQYMDATLYTGNGTTNVIVNQAQFQPDFVWGKSRSLANSHILSNSVAGATKFLISNSTAAEGTNAQAYVSFNSNGFTLGTDTSLNSSGATNVAWQWQAGQGTTSSNTSGSITSTVSVNTTAGFSIVTYTGTGANATVGHGLGVAPAMIICKSRSNANGWIVWHKSLASGASYLNLESTAAVASESTLFQSTIPNSTVITLGTNLNVNRSAGSQLIYAFAEIAGFSKFGSYTGNGSADGPFVYLGFRPKFVMVKIYSGTTGDWAIFDTSRSTYNEEKLVLWPNLSIAESTGTNGIDGLANGFKIRNNSNYINGSSSYSYIYMAFAETPFRYSLGR